MYLAKKDYLESSPYLFLVTGNKGLKELQARYAHLAVSGYYGYAPIHARPGFKVR